MSKTILITGSSDGIGREAARVLVKKGHHVLLHGRSPHKLEPLEAELSSSGTVERYVADLSNLDAVIQLAKTVSEKHKALDVLINNAGVLEIPDTPVKDGLDIRFIVNALAPYLLTKMLLPFLAHEARVINLSSAAQSPVSFDALSGKHLGLSAMDAYAQSKLAITMWSRAMAISLGKSGPTIVSVNPGSLLGTKMVKEKFGIDGKDIHIGADILVRAALSEAFHDASGTYFDNDKGCFADPHPDALDTEKCNHLMAEIDALLQERGFISKKDPH